MVLNIQCTSTCNSVLYQKIKEYNIHTESTCSVHDTIRSLSFVALGLVEADGNKSAGVGMPFQSEHS